MADMYAKRYEVTPRKLRRILRFIQKRRIKVSIVYRYYNSVGYRETRRYDGIIKDYSVTVDDDIDYKEFNIRITFEDGSKLEETLNSYHYFNPYNKDKMSKVEIVYADGSKFCNFDIARRDQFWWRPENV